MIKIFLIFKNLHRAKYLKQVRRLFSAVTVARKLVFSIIYSSKKLLKLIFNQMYVKTIYLCHKIILALVKKIYFVEANWSITEFDKKLLDKTRCVKKIKTRQG